MSSAPDHLAAAETELTEAFELLHRRNGEARQLDDCLREAVAACSAALAQVRRAIGHMNVHEGKRQGEGDG